MIKYQADNADPPETQGETRKWLDDQCEDPIKGGSIISQYERENPGLKRFKRKPLINWAMWKKKFGTRSSNAAVEGLEPYEKEEWIKKMNRENGWPRSRCETLWDEFKDSRQCKITATGLDGAEEMWLPKKPAELKTKENFIEGAAEF